MKLKTEILLIIFSLLHILCISQVKDTINTAYVSVQNDEIDYSSIKKVQNPKISDYQGSYHFGESEGESQLEIIYSNGKLFARSKYNEREQDDWILKHDRTPIKYVNGKIKIGKSTYELYICTQTTYSTLVKGRKGLGSHFFESTQGKIHHYIQFNPNNNIEKSRGRHPETSFVKLTLKDLSSFSKYDLKIMRNEIFARNGHIFKEGGEMRKYFSKKEWYRSIRKTSHLNLSPIEKYNIDLILKLEKSQ